MTRFSPGIYQLINVHGTGKIYYELDNQKYWLHNESTVTVRCYNWLAVDPAQLDSNMFINKIGNHPNQISGNVAKWTT